MYHGRGLFWTALGAKTILLRPAPPENGANKEAGFSRKEQRQTARIDPAAWKAAAEME
jgi:hypothetical protein